MSVAHYRKVRTRGPASLPTPRAAQVPVVVAAGTSPGQKGRA
jgi:hypothetical protein